MTIHVSIDTEASGPAPGAGDMISAGFVVIDPQLREPGFKPLVHATGIIRPLCENFSEGAYKSIGMSREEHIEKAVIDRQGAFYDLLEWCRRINPDNERLTGWSDNPAFDWQWINHGFAMSGFENPFGHSMRRIGDLYAGARGMGKAQNKWKSYRITKHTHDPVDDAMGNAEALLRVDKEFELGLWH